MDMPWESSIYLRAVAVAILVGGTAGAVGCVLLLRRLTLFADAFAHALLPGVALAWLLFGGSLAAMAAGALGAGLLTALAGAVVARTTRLREDAAAGAVFVVLAAAGLALFSRTATSGDLLHLLFGNILGATRADLVLAAVAAVAAAGVLALLYRPILLECFDPVFHRAAGGRSRATHAVIVALVVLTIVAALQGVGLMLAVGLLVLPAATAHLCVDRFGTMLVVATAVGALGAAAGLTVSWYLPGMPSGAGMVLALGVAFAAALAGGRHGWRSRGQALG
jgi:zinc/manganese transport system permease protein